MRSKWDSHSRCGYWVLVRLVLALVLCLVAAACNGEQVTEETPQPTEAGPGALDFGNVETVAGSLEVPWEIAFPDDDTILVTERPGRVRIVRDGGVRPEPAAEIDVRASGEAGLLGLALHPDFPDERFAYVYYTSADDNRVSRFPLDDELRFGEEEIVVDGIPAAGVHDGGRIAFGPDGLLYIGTGDAGTPSRAADLESLGGKILRVTPDGEVPGDNPFDDSPVYSYGHRNVQGLGWDGDGTLYASEHGPTGEFGLCCHDEINEIEAGGFYGWPNVAGEATAAGGTPPADPVPPLAESGEEVWAPAGLAVHQDRLVVATLRGEGLLSFDAESPGSPDEELDDLGRMRAARFGPDECLYLTTSNTDGRGSPRESDDRIVRVCPS